MKTTDLSVIVTAHSETAICGPTMNAAQQAIATAEATGINVERLITLDNATPQTREWFAQFKAEGWRIITTGHGDLGRTRNTSVAQAKGTYIAFLDADDLFSQNWLLNGVRRLRQAEADGEHIIVHPELNWLFDGASSVFLKPDQDDPLFTPYHFYFNNYYDSLALMPRAAHLAHPYVARDIPNGFSFQDWQFSIASMAGGWKHVSARDTIIFKRRRDGSLVTESRDRRALIRTTQAMAIDKVATLSGPRHTPAHTPRLSGQSPPISFPMETGKIPHYGPALANRIAQARAQVRTRGIAKVHALIRPHFDLAFYLANNPDIARNPDIDPVRHYIRAGASEGRDPSPLFSTKAYLSRNPDVAKSGVNPFYHWLKTGWNEDRIGAPHIGFSTLSRLLDTDKPAAEAIWGARYRDLRARLEHGDLGAQVALAAVHDPLIEQSWSAALSVKIPPFNSQITVTRTNAIHDLQTQAASKPARFVICVNKPRWGGAKRLEGHIAHALAEGFRPEDVLLITTDESGNLPENRIPKGVRHVDLKRAAGPLKGDACQRLLIEFIRSLGAEIVFNVNSRLLWAAMKPYGKALASSTRIIGCFLCNEQNPLGHWSGYPLTQFYRHFDILDHVLTDSHFLANDLIARYRVPPAQQGKIRVVSTPVDPGIPALPVPTAKPRPQVFWAGRLDPQKRVDLVFDIANAMPHVDFRLWGSAVLAGQSSLPKKPSNVVLEGTYENLIQLPLQQANLWLYTSAWDGVPQMLLEVAMTGLPLVGTLVGGTGEVLRHGFCASLDPEQAQIADWQAAITGILADPEDAHAKALHLRQVLVKERSCADFRETLLKVVHRENPFKS